MSSVISIERVIQGVLFTEPAAVVRPRPSQALASEIDKRLAALLTHRPDSAANVRKHRRSDGPVPRAQYLFICRNTVFLHQEVRGYLLPPRPEDQVENSFWRPIWTILRAWEKGQIGTLEALTLIESHLLLPLNADEEATEAAVRFYEAWGLLSENEVLLIEAHLELNPVEAPDAVRHYLHDQYPLSTYEQALAALLESIPAWMAATGH